MDVIQSVNDIAYEFGIVESLDVSISSFEFARREARQLRLLNKNGGHPCIPKVIGPALVQIDDVNYGGVIMERANGFSLEDERIINLDLSEKVKIMQALSDTLLYIHGQSYLESDIIIPTLHNDLKLSSVIVELDEFGKFKGLKLIDYGNATGVTNNTALAVTENYTSKKTLATKMFTMKNEVFAYSAICFHILFGKDAFNIKKWYQRQRAPFSFNKFAKENGQMLGGLGFSELQKKYLGNIFEHLLNEEFNVGTYSDVNFVLEDVIEGLNQV
jgi:serine/threonine protein kinase